MAHGFSFSKLVWGHSVCINRRLNFSETFLSGHGSTKRTRGILVKNNLCDSQFHRHRRGQRGRTVNSET